MQFVSTRDPNNKVSFSHAILNCIPKDGGLYVPAFDENLTPWILYMDDKTPFTSIAGSLTSALVKEEFSPIISEAIATKAFPFSPVLKQLDDNLYHLELFHGPTGSHKDFGISYLASCLEHIGIMNDKKSVVLSYTTGEAGVSTAYALKDKKHLCAVLLYPKGTMRGLDPSYFVWNGGNIYPVEVEGTADDCHNLVRTIYADSQVVSDYSITVANTFNIGRLLPQAFFYTYAFTRLKNKVCSDIYYALSSGNYGNLIAGLYSWKFSLPVNGFITNCSVALCVDAKGKCVVPDAEIPLNMRSAADPAVPSNIERLEEIFATSPAVMRGLVFPAPVSSEDTKKALQELFVKYKVIVSPQTAEAYAAAKAKASFVAEDDGTVVLVSRDHPAFSAEKIRQMCGEAPEITEEIQAVLKPMTSGKVIAPDKDQVLKILQELK